MTYNELKRCIDEYHKKVRPSFDNVFKELEKEYKDATITGNFDDLVRHIVKGWNGKVHNHQRRMPKTSAEAAVLAFSGFTWRYSPKNTTFEDLYAEVEKRMKGIPFCQGPLTVYDVSLRIGKCLGIEPKVFVYLSAGAKIGARRLLNQKKLKNIESVSFFPSPLCNEPCIYIEDILCTFKDVFLPPNDKDYKSIDNILTNISCISCNSNRKPSISCHQIS